MIAKTFPPIYIETALLGMGLPSISNEEMLEHWAASPAQQDNPVDSDTYLVWMEKGKFMLGDLPRFLTVRTNPGMRRIDGTQMETAQENNYSGFLTASAVMRLATAAGAITVTAGMGGIRGADRSDDLFCLTNLPVWLVATAPKDVLDQSATLRYLIGQGTRVTGWQTARCDGFLFRHPPVVVTSLPRLADVTGREHNSGSLVLNPIPARDRLPDEKMLQEALAEGIAAVKQGESFHPAVNAVLDRLSHGVSSMLQLRALVQNIQLAAQIREQLILAKDDEFNDSRR